MLTCASRGELVFELRGVLPSDVFLERGRFFNLFEAFGEDGVRTEDGEETQPAFAYLAAKAAMSSPRFTCLASSIR